ncbi:MAG: chemotaxis protein CheW [Pseudomonadota bacterium]
MTDTQRHHPGDLTPQVANMAPNSGITGGCNSMTELGSKDAPDPVRNSNGDPSADPAIDPLIELLALTLGGQDYAVDIMSVREIRSHTDPTPLPHAPDYICGVINLRGTVLPVVDLSRRLGLGTGSGSERSVTVVLQHDGRTFGIVVDAVSDILARPASALQAPPDFTNIGDSCIAALIVEDTRMFRVLDINSLLAVSGVATHATAPDAAAALAAATHAPPAPAATGAVAATDRGVPAA